MKNRDKRNGDRRPNRKGQDFNDILRQIDDDIRPPRMGFPFPHPDFAPDRVTKSVKAFHIQLPAPNGADDDVIVPREEYNEFVAAKATMGLLISAAEHDALNGYDIANLLRMMSGIGKEQDAPAATPETAAGQAAEA